MFEVPVNGGPLVREVSDEGKYLDVGGPCEWDPLVREVSDEGKYLDVGGP